MDKIVFNRLLSALRPKMYRLALSFTRRTDEAEDVVQDVGIKLWERRDDLAAFSSVEAYAMNAVRNRCIDVARSPHNRMDELVEAHDTAHGRTPHQMLEQADMAAFVRKLVERLPEQQKMVMRLRDIEGYELDEIAQILEITDGAVRTNLSRARQKIRDELLKHTL